MTFQKPLNAVTMVTFDIQRFSTVEMHVNVRGATDKAVDYY